MHPLAPNRVASRPSSAQAPVSSTPPLPVSSSGPAPGTHLARCSACIDLGTHTDAPAGKPARAVRRLLLTFTLFAADGSTTRLSRQFTHSTDCRSALSRFLTPWLGTSWQTTAKGVKVLAITEQPCLLTLQESSTPNPRTGRPYLNIAAASPLVHGLTVPDLKWPATVFSLKAPQRDTFRALPQWIQSKIRSSAEWQTLLTTRH